MNVAIIIAGGVGSRMGQEIPKQFINVGEKPVIVYTLERSEERRRRAPLGTRPSADTP